ncbi:MAG: citrate (Si)-synthase [Anaerolineales bacterium]|nr:citrate (Si)-synthase [Anaerolineales bacterium]
MILKEKIAAQLPEWQARVRKLVKENGDVIVGEVNVNQVYGGMRGAKVLVTDISYVDPEEGIRFRGYTIPELLELLPKAENSNFPLSGGLFYLLLIGEIPTFEEAMAVEEEWKARGEIPAYVLDVIKSMPADSHPMTMFSQAILALQNDSVFAKGYQEGMPKADYWEATLEDSLNLTAKLPAIAAFIYNRKFGNGEFVPPRANLDWAGNFAHMVGKDTQAYQDLTRLYFFLHSDHESGNASAHATHLVGSTLADVYYACSAGIHALAGPLHGLANQMSLKWLLSVRDEFGGLPTREQFEKYCWDTLNSGQVIPGYGHAVLRQPDPRYTAQFKFGQEFMPDDELFQLVELAFEVIPKVLGETGKVKNPWPNVDAVSGTLQYHYGMCEFDFYTVLFGVSRILGVTSNAVWARALGQPLERPKSLTTKMLEDIVSQAK